jgi:hypothetical protein
MFHAILKNRRGPHSLKTVIVFMSIQLDTFLVVTISLSARILATTLPSPDTPSIQNPSPCSQLNYSACAATDGCTYCGDNTCINASTTMCCEGITSLPSCPIGSSCCSDWDNDMGQCCPPNASCCSTSMQVTCCDTQSSQCCSDNVGNRAFCCSADGTCCGEQCCEAGQICCGEWAEVSWCCAAHQICGNYTTDPYNCYDITKTPTAP